MHTQLHSKTDFCLAIDTQSLDQLSEYYAQNVVKNALHFRRTLPPSQGS
jgi:hypothetical protein